MIRTWNVATSAGRPLGDRSDGDVLEPQSERGYSMLFRRLIDHRATPMFLITNCNFPPGRRVSTLILPGRWTGSRGPRRLWRPRPLPARQEDASERAESRSPVVLGPGTRADWKLFTTWVRDLHRARARAGSQVYVVGAVGTAVLLQRRCRAYLPRARPLPHDARRPPHTAEYRGPQLLQSFLVRGAQSRRRIGDPGRRSHPDPGPGTAAERQTRLHADTLQGSSGWRASRRQSLSRCAGP
jgi:hypothetical protein